MDGETVSGFILILRSKAINYFNVFNLFFFFIISKIRLQGYAIRHIFTNPFNHEEKTKRPLFLRITYITNYFISQINWSWRPFSSEVLFRTEVHQIHL
jgi:hypothetical protein